MVLPRALPRLQLLTNPTLFLKAQPEQIPDEGDG